MGERLHDKFDEDPWHEGISGRVTKDQLRFAHDRMAAEDERQKQEEDLSPWIKSGMNNVMKQDRLPRATRPQPSHPGDEEKFR